MSLPRKPSSQAAAGELIDSGRSTTSLHHPVLHRIIKADRLLIIAGFGYLPMSRAQTNLFHSLLAAIPGFLARSCRASTC
jgi:hypothetical protein